MDRGWRAPGRYARITMSNSNAPLEVTLRGQHVYLAPLRTEHVDALAAASAEAAAAGDTELYKWSPVPQSRAEVERYIESALTGRDAGTMLPFTTHRGRQHRHRLHAVLLHGPLGLAAHERALH